MSTQIHSLLWQHFIRAVKLEVKPALGCTEPISLALAAAKAAAYLQGPITRVQAFVSPNLMKNGMGVTVPGTGMVGLPIAAALGAIGGDAEADLEVLKSATEQAIEQSKKMLAEGTITVDIKSPCADSIYAEANVFTAQGCATVVIAGTHTRVVKIINQGTVEFDLALSAGDPDALVDCAEDIPLPKVTAKEVYRFATQAPFEDISFILESASLNDALSKEGLENVYGLHIGRTLRTQRDRGLLSKDLLSDIMIRTTAASDARMGGAKLPAMSNSGSGNQGIAATMPVVVTADYLQSTEEQRARALMLSHLMAIYIHSQLPPLSALCAATTASMGAAAGIAWLLEARYEVVAMAISSMIGDVSGMICDGASNGCAMKVSTGASAAYKAVLMALDNSCVRGSDGIVSDDVDQSILNLCSLATGSMRHTDVQIIEIMATKAKYA
nr:L-serine ammonia-lyase, iron-sulfur-dependent, subunit alpha [uncultured Moellerella sp.]